MQNPSLLTLENVLSAPIEHGDAGIIIKPDGSFKVFATGVEGDLTPEQMQQGEILVALSVALKFPQVMEVLKNMARDPALVGDGIDTSNAH